MTIVAPADFGTLEMAFAFVGFAVIYGAGFGLGGWGSLTLVCLKRLFREEMATETFRFLSIDTVESKEAMRTERAGLTEEDLALIAPERMRVSFRAGEDFDVYNHPDIAAIVPKDVQPFLRDPAVTVDGGQAIRSLGAASLYWSWPDVRARVRDDVLRRLFTDTDPRAGQDSHNRLLLFVFASICGGSGSGMLTPFAMLLRDLKGEAIHMDATTIGIFALPEVFISPTQRNLANAYATLQEINYFMRPDTTFPLPGSERAISDPPFDVVYLVPPSNGVFQLASPRRAAELAAQFAFHSFKD